MSADGGLAAVVDGKGFSPLYLAAALGRADMVDVLIAGSPPDGVKSPAYYAGPDGQTALHAAVLASEGKLPIFLWHFVLAFDLIWFLMMCCIYTT
jgi:ankyrin repeat protein